MGSGRADMCMDGGLLGSVNEWWMNGSVIDAWLECMVGCVCVCVCV